MTAIGFGDDETDERSSLSGNAFRVGLIRQRRYRPSLRRMALADRSLAVERQITVHGARANPFFDGASIGFRFRFAETTRRVIEMQEIAVAELPFWVVGESHIIEERQICSHQFRCERANDNFRIVAHTV